MNIRAVCFDMDGTLIRNTDSVEYLCGLNGNIGQLGEIKRLENQRRITWIEADYRKAGLLRGLEIDKVEHGFDRDVELIENIETVLTYLRRNQIRAALVTAGPGQVADILSTKYSFDDVRASTYEVKNGRFTGKILTHLGVIGKQNVVRELCREYDLGPENWVAIGDSDSDIEIFEMCAESIAINYSNALEGQASKYFTTDDLSDIMDTLRDWISG
ncbi:MAG: HAD-IB family phosphatase [bacterium]